MSDYDSDNESFKSAEDGLNISTVSSAVFPAKEEASLLCESNSRKSTANSLFGEASYDEAILNYDKALSFCPNYLEFEVAVLRSNIAACHIKLQDWKSAVESATKSLQCLERLDPPMKSPLKNDGGDGGGGITAQVVEEVDDSTAVIIESFQKSGRSMMDVRKLRVKALMRRARARTELEGWSDLQGANEDYMQLAAMPELSTVDRKIVDSGLASISPKVASAKEREMGEMIEKLKGLGNGILKPFGLSTKNFNFVQDEKTGGYSMQFNQGT